MSERETTLLGIPIPSDDKVFIGILLVHIFFGLVCVLSGLVAMVSNKTRSIHPLVGKIYYFSMVLAFATVILLSIMRWPFNIHLLTIGTLTFSFAYLGRRLAHSRKPGWTRLHTICMGLSYILLLTGFYVDNGKNLPFWRQFPSLFFWVFPGIVGVPIIVYALLNHPMNRMDRSRENPKIDS
jgi:uncharacterized membrane protein